MIWSQVVKTQFVTCNIYTGMSDLETARICTVALRERGLDVVITASKVRYQREKTRKADMKELEGKMVRGE